MVLKEPSEILVLLLVNLGNGILINLIFKFSKFFNFSALFSAIVYTFECLWVYSKGPSKYRFRFSLLKYLGMAFGPYYIP